MVHKASRPTVHDMRAMKARGQKISMLYVTTLDEAAAADAAGIHMLSIECRFFSPEMREAAGNCFVQVGLPFGPYVVPGLSILACLYIISDLSAATYRVFFIWIAVAIVLRISSLSALVATALAPLYAFATDQPPAVIILAAFTGVLVWIRHAPNIQRLLKGQEPRIGGDKKAKA